MDHVVNAYNRLDTPIVRGEGAYLFDKDGKKYLDFAAGISTTSLGHCHPYITDKLKEQSSSLWHCSNIFTIPEQERLAEHLTTLTFADKVFSAQVGLKQQKLQLSLFVVTFIQKGKQNVIVLLQLKEAFMAAVLLQFLLEAMKNHAKVLLRSFLVLIKCQEITLKH